jgi:hypothetical protein
MHFSVQNMQSAFIMAESPAASDLPLQGLKPQVLPHQDVQLKNVQLKSQSCR